MATYCGVTDLRDEGFADPPYTDERITTLCDLATRYVDKVTGRWFEARTFDDTNPLMLDGKNSRTLHLMIPIIRLDKLEIENQGLVSSDLTDINLDYVRTYNRHLSGMTQPDDRENPRISFVEAGRIAETVATGLYPAPHVFPHGRQNIVLEGVFGYTDPDGSATGETPRLIKRACVLLVVRDLRLESDACEKLNDRNRWRIIMDKEDTTTVRLQELWLKGAFTGNPEIDTVLMAYKRPPRMAVV